MQCIPLHNMEDRRHAPSTVATPILSQLRADINVICVLNYLLFTTTHNAYIILKLSCSSRVI